MYFLLEFSPGKVAAYPKKKGGHNVGVANYIFLLVCLSDLTLVVSF